MLKSSSYGHMLFEKTVIGLALCKMNGDLVDVNIAFAQLLGRSIEEVLTLTYWEITPKKYAEQEKSQLESLDKTGRYGPYEKEYIHADGHLVPVRLSGQIVEIDGEQYIWSSVEDITDRKHAEEELTRLYKKVERLSFQDELTGIANRRMLDQTLDREWKRAQRDQTSLSLIMLDIDYFKQYNDCYGHQQGDECLKQVAKSLSKVTRRAIDLISRYGGEEFVILLPETNKDQSIKLTEQCLNVVKEQSLPHKLSKVSDVVTVSAGVCTAIPAVEAQPSILIETADKLLYQAKQKGRNRFEYELE